MLNLPKELNFGSNKKINYFYNFDGEKQRQVVENNGTLTKVDYCGPFVYETASGVRSLKFFTTSEGRALKNGSTWDFEYNLKDHLGNVRTVIRKGSDGLAEVVQEKHYYAFGLEMSPLSRGSSTNKYLYNGKEYQNDLGLGWYDYGARFYDPALGRWHTVDPLAESYRRWSPYAYGVDNPMRFIDPDGMGILDRVLGSVVGVATNLTNPLTSMAVREYTATHLVSDTRDYNDALTKADVVSLASGVAMGVGGGAMVAGGLAGAPETAGASLAVSGVGVAVSATGVVLSGNAAINLAIGNTYGNLKEPRNVGEGKSTTSSQRQRILEENKKNNNGELRSDGDGRKLDAPSKVNKGEKANMNQAEVDHIQPKSKGGSNSNENLRVISKEENLRKGNRTE